MESSLRKYLTKFQLFLLAIVIFLVIATVAPNIILFSYKNIITQAIDKYFSQELSAQNLFYLPPNFIILKKVSVLETAPPKEKQLFFIPTIRLKLSFLEFLTKRHLIIQDVRLYKPQVNCAQAQRFLKDNFAQITEFIRHLPKQDIRFSIEKARLDLALKGQEPNYIWIDLSLMMKGDSISGLGAINKRGLPLRYRFRGALTKYGFSLENLEFLRENLYAKLWGSSNGNALTLKGFSFMDTLFNERKHREAPFNLIERVKFLLYRSSLFLETMAPHQINLYVLDIDCQINLKFPHLQIEQLGFSLNSIPVSLKGDIFFLDPIALDLMLSVYPPYLGNIQRPDTERVGLKITGVLRDRAFYGDGKLNLDFARKKSGIPLTKATLVFKDSNLYFAQYPHLKMSLGEADLFCSTENNTYKIFLQDFKSIFNLQDKRFKYAKFNSLFYDGFLEGRLWVDLKQLPPKISSLIRVKDVGAQKLETLLIYFSKVYGRLTAQMYFSNYPNLNLKGSMDIRKGYLHDFDFFKWLADFFDLPSLKRIDFDRASLNFLVNAGGAGLDEIDLNAADMDLNGYFRLGKNDLVSSRLSLTFAPDLMQESPKCNSLLKLLDKDLKPLSFVFQLSGDLHAMNFQWLESDFKRELTELIPNFIERRIEKNIEEIIDSFSVK